MVEASSRLEIKEQKINKKLERRILKEDDLREAIALRIEFYAAIKDILNVEILQLAGSKYKILELDPTTENDQIVHVIEELSL